jgi:hypothetical protein
MKIVIKILFTILLTIKKKNHIFHLQNLAHDQDLFYLLAHVEGVGDIMAKKNYLPIVVRLKPKQNNCSN